MIHGVNQPLFQIFGNLLNLNYSTGNYYIILTQRSSCSGSYTTPMCLQVLGARLAEGGVGSPISGSDTVYVYRYSFVSDTYIGIYVYILHRDRLNAIRLKGKRGG